LDLQPNDVDLYGGISGISMELPSFELSDGVSLNTTYAHIMAPYILAFKPPPPRGPHPGPYKAASGGIGFDITLEIFVPKGDRPTNFTRINTIWWVAALMRLLQPTGLRVPVISSISFTKILKSPVEPNFWSMEMNPRQWVLGTMSDSVLSSASLHWMKKFWQPASTLMDIPSFNAAFQAFDQACWSQTVGSALLMLWSSIEALIRPGARDIGCTLSKCVATYLEEPGARRDRLFAATRRLYERRGVTAHAAELPDGITAKDTFAIARRCFLRALQDETLPEGKLLLERWTKRT
jgi:hypothetical protein